MRSHVSRLVTLCAGTEWRARAIGVRERTEPANALRNAFSIHTVFRKLFSHFWRSKLRAPMCSWLGGLVHHMASPSQIQVELQYDFSYKSKPEPRSPPPEQCGRKQLSSTYLPILCRIGGKPGTWDLTFLQPGPGNDFKHDFTRRPAPEQRWLRPADS
jgi:hypothetical protein